jgi:hypothetical protein
MTKMMLRMIRALIAAGVDDDVILSTMSDAETVDTPAVTRRTAPAVTPARVTRATFQKPNQTSVTYRSTLRGANPAKQLDKLGVTGNKRAVMDYVLAAGGPVDSRQLRAAVLTHKLRKDGTNKAVESAVHGLKTDGLLVAKSKPAAPATMPGNGVELGDDEE